MDAISDPEQLQDGRAIRAHSPLATGLYRPEDERDACGVGFIADRSGHPTRDVVSKALTAVSCLAHRGAVGCDPHTGDGAGLMTQIPRMFFARVCAEIGIALPRMGMLGVGMLFLPTEAELRRQCLAIVTESAQERGFRVWGVRDVPTDSLACGAAARSTLPHVAQVFVTASFVPADASAFERDLYVLRRIIERRVLLLNLPKDQTFYVCSLSGRTLVYKGMLLSEQLPIFFPDLSQPDFISAIAVFHQRFSTNTTPTWERAHPYRLIAHNGEFNTLRGNVAWMKARERSMQSSVLGDDIAQIRPILDERGSDTAIFDNSLELLLRAGRSLPHALAMMMPEAWENHAELSQELRDFYAYHSSLMEPWDGPACVVFSDGIKVGAALDRNGLRPSRFTITHSGLVVLASEAGVLDIPAIDVARKGRLRPGDMLVVDISTGEVRENDAIKARLAKKRPFGEWFRTRAMTPEALPEPPFPDEPPEQADTLVRRQRLFGYSQEDLRLLLAEMATTGKEPVGSMGNDTPLAVLSERPQLLYQYFKQAFAQVTNPPIDPIREALVMSLRTRVGHMGNLLDDDPHACRQIMLESPVLPTAVYHRLARLNLPGLQAVTFSTVFDPTRRPEALQSAVSRLCYEVETAVFAGSTVIILSDRASGKGAAPIPALLATSAVHHHLVRQGLRTSCSLVVDSGEVWEVMHYCLLLGYGASAIHPYLSYQTILSLAAGGMLAGTDPASALENYSVAINQGILKVMTKMGISVLQSYRGAQVFEAIGLSREFVDRYFTDTPTRLSGIGLEEVTRDIVRRHEYAFDADLELSEPLEQQGRYQWRRQGEFHMYSPETIGLLQHAVRSGSYDVFRKFAAKADNADDRFATLRGLFEFQGHDPIPLESVEPVESIVRRFKTGAMSLGSISREAHENLAIATNRIGARSNTGEGGEDPERYFDERRSAIKQVASGRFGVTIDYLVHCDEIQIKMAQGAKPGEGGQLPGHKVDDYIARIRCSTPGVGLISPPPHHDIYSIEDLAQLIHDLKCANPTARISVKLVSEVGVGTIAAGVAKAKAHTILISGYSGGTGASPLTSIHHAGAPWELGLAETHQALVASGLRDRVRLEVDGQLKTGRDVVIACLLGAEEFGFGTAALVAQGCVLMRVCHLNTCPVGIATQDPVLRKRFAGQPEHVIHYFMFVATHTRSLMAELGFRTVDEMVGQVNRLKVRTDVKNPKAKSLDLSVLLHEFGPQAGPLHHRAPHAGPEGHVLDHGLVVFAEPALSHGIPVDVELPIRNVHRSVGTLLSSEIARRVGGRTLPDALIRFRFQGAAGQSFGAFLASGVELWLEGEANDYVGKGMTSGRIIVYPPKDAAYLAEENTVVGNVTLYGATGGELYVRGQAGERFAVRNSGAMAVVEGLGDHGCEYMTGGLVIVLGGVGRNFAAGMSGGYAFVFDRDGLFKNKCNKDMVDIEPVDEEDAAMLRRWIMRHREFTDSAVAWRLLRAWPTESQRFKKVFPKELRRALSEQSSRVAASVA